MYSRKCRVISQKDSYYGLGLFYFFIQLCQSMVCDILKTYHFPYICFKFYFYYLSFINVVKAFTFTIISVLCFQTRLRYYFSIFRHNFACFSSYSEKPPIGPLSLLIKFTCMGDWVVYAKELKFLHQVGSRVSI